MACGHNELCPYKDSVFSLRLLVKNKVIQSNRFADEPIILNISICDVLLRFYFAVSSTCCNFEAKQTILKDEETKHKKRS